jgi:hypothetical protein
MAVHLPVFSPTQIKFWKGPCLRKAAFRYIDRVKLSEDVAPWKAQGTRMHAHLAQAKRSGLLPDQTDPEARVASTLMGYWPARKDWEPEAKIEVHRGTHIFRGESDQFGKSWGFVGDYKFTGNLKNTPWDTRPFWVKDLEPIKATKELMIEGLKKELFSDPQFTIYGGATEGPLVRGRWTYAVKPPKLIGEPKVLPIDVSATRDRVEIELKKLDAIAHVALWVKANYTSANDVPHAADVACGGIGMRCDYSAFCTKEGPMFTLEQLAAQAGVTLNGGGQPAQAQAQAAPAVNPPDAVVPAPAPEAQAAPQEVLFVNEATAAPAPEKVKRGRKPRPPADATQPRETDDVECVVTNAYLDGGECVVITLKAPLNTSLPIGGKVYLSL